MASNAFANAAAAVSGGYIKTQTDRGVTYVAAERYQTTFSFPLAGAAGESGFNVELTAYGASQAAADTAAVVVLNSWRVNRYGSDSATANAANSGPAGKKHTLDKT